MIFGDAEKFSLKHQKENDQELCSVSDIPFIHSIVQYIWHIASQVSLTLQKCKIQ